MSGPGREFSNDNPAWNQSPSQFDRYLVKRQSPLLCGEPNGDRSDYNLELHIGSVFIILFVSASACAFPLLATKVPRMKIPPRFLFAVRHFGTGVLLATAFVHLLPTAFTNLTDPCLGGFWTEDYPAMAGAIALLAVFGISIIEMVFSPGRSCCTVTAQEASPVSMDEMRFEDKQPGPNPPDVESPEDSSLASGVGPLYGRTKLGRRNSTGQQLARMTSGSASPSLRGHNVSGSGRSDSGGQHLARMTCKSVPELTGEDEDNITATDDFPAHDDSSAVEHVASPSPSVSSNLKSPELTRLADLEAGVKDLKPTADQKRQKLLLQCLLLELGILFHSVFIGMALAVAVGNSFIVLLLAIVFHQTFEGLALGSRIAAVEWSPAQAKGWHRYQPLMMALAYGCTTPFGQAIGIATHTLYSPSSRTGLIMVGIMNSISAGLLTYTSLVDLLAEEFISDESWRTLKGKKRIVAFLVMFAGAAGMSLIGAWA
ncbi:Zinc-regulated transporter 2 [Cyphellophora attinorum]|uniref:Zinc-regulated transporter 2 n=1 Tax=Cyphellophora attinorum TaxID=1664694 RepID=A0A0N1HG37_9EURO|nr:Zinc-regulated transporter 2 [Phialophora attinorum]KPI44466.1 Zinc-regulated transporter 2 [Phialophora attinorum]